MKNPLHILLELSKGLASFVSSIILFYIVVRGYGSIFTEGGSIQFILSLVASPLACAALSFLFGKYLLKGKTSVLLIAQLSFIAAVLWFYYQFTKIHADPFPLVY